MEVSNKEVIWYVDYSDVLEYNIMPKRLKLDANPTVNPHFVHLVHQLADEVEPKAGVAESRDLALRREDHLGVLDRVLEIIFAPHFAATIPHHSAAVAASLWEARVSTSLSPGRPPNPITLALRGAKRLNLHRLESRWLVRPPARDGVGGKDCERDPDEREGQHLRAPKRLVKRRCLSRAAQLGERYWRKPTVVRRR